MDDLTAFGKLVGALRPWLKQLVLVGGWAHRLYRGHALANPPSYQPVLTTDADIAISLTAPPVGDIRAALESAGFQKDLFGEHAPPVTHYHLDGEDTGFYVEFLAPLHGRGYKKDGTADATVTKAGVTAQKLRHLELLLLHPWTIRVGQNVGIPLSIPADVRVANPVSFIVQKLLIERRRSPDKQAQDTLYIHDTLDLFGTGLDKLNLIWTDQLRPTLPQKLIKDIELRRIRRFRAVTDVIRTAALIPQDRRITAERLQAACEFGLEQILRAEELSK